MFGDAVFTGNALGIDKQTKFLLALIIGICIGLMFDKNFGLFRADGTAPAGR